MKKFFMTTTLLMLFLGTFTGCPPKENVSTPDGAPPPSQWDTAE